MEELDNLYNVITREGLFTQSLDIFKNKLNSDPDYKRKVYDVVVAKGLYTKNYDWNTVKTLNSKKLIVKDDEGWK